MKLLLLKLLEAEKKRYLLKKPKEMAGSEFKLKMFKNSLKRSKPL
jgi:hypothetical protein